MSPRLALALVLAAVGGTAALAQDAAKPIRKPVWDELPPAEAVDKAYPTVAYNQAIGGKVVLSCKVLDTGRLEACTAKSETPTDQGFAEAALSLAPGFKMRATTEEGQATAGGTVRIPIEFSPPPSPTITKPMWLRKPSGAAVAKAYPDDAMRSGIGGKVVLSCTVTAEGLVEGCKVVSETPVGRDFGKAALRLSRYFQMTKTTDDGQPVAGAIVHIPISFSSNL